MRARSAVPHIESRRPRSRGQRSVRRRTALSCATARERTDRAPASAAGCRRPARSRRTTRSAVPDRARAEFRCRSRPMRSPAAGLRPDGGSRRPRRGTTATGRVRALRAARFCATPARVDVGRRPVPAAVRIHGPEHPHRRTRGSRWQYSRSVSVISAPASTSWNARRCSGSLLAMTPSKSKTTRAEALTSSFFRQHGRQLSGGFHAVDRDTRTSGCSNSTEW